MQIWATDAAVAAGTETPYEPIPGMEMVRSHAGVGVGRPRAAVRVSARHELVDVTSHGSARMVATALSAWLVVFSMSFTPLGLAILVRD